LLKRLATILILTVAASASASANVLIWTLENVTFMYATATGSFGYDADTRTLSDIDIIIEGDLASEFTSGTATSDHELLFSHSPFSLTLTTAAPLTSGGGTIPLVVSGGVFYEIIDPDFYLLMGDALTGGQITVPSGAAAAPEPGTFLLMAPAGGLALWIGRRRKGRKASEDR
jgi:hypothetical protein